MEGASPCPQRKTARNEEAQILIFLHQSTLHAKQDKNYPFPNLEVPEEGTFSVPTHLLWRAGWVYPPSTAGKLLRVCELLLSLPIGQHRDGRSVQG